MALGSSSTPPRQLSVTESVARSRLFQRGEPMSDTSYFHDKAEQCRRLARDSTDPMLAQSLTELAVEYETRAAAMDGSLSAARPEHPRLER